MFGGSFAGAAAQGLNQSLLDWQRIWLQEEELEKADKREQERLDFENLRLQWEQERTAAAEAGADRRFNLQLEQERLNNMWQAFSKTTSPAVKASQAEAFRGTSYYDFAVSSVTEGFFQDYLEANTYLQGMYNAPIGTYYDPTMVKAAAEVSGRFGLNLEGDALQNYIDERVKWAEGTTLEATEERERQRNRLELDDSTARANLENIEASTRATDAQAEYTRANIEWGTAQNWREEMRLVWEGDNHQANLALLQQEFEQNERINPLLYQSLMYDNNGKLHDQQIRDATKEATIQMYLDNANLVGIERQLKQIELNFAFDNAELDVAIKRDNRTHIQTTIQSILQGIKESEARITSAGVDDEVARQAMEEERIRTFTSLMSSGHVDLAREYGREFVQDIVGEEGFESMLKNMEERAQRGLDTESAELEAARELAYWQIQYAEENARNESRLLEAQADRADTQAQYEEDRIKAEMAESSARIRVSDGQLALQSYQRQQYDNQTSGGTPAPPPPTGFYDFMEDRRLTFGWNLSNITDFKTNYDLTEQSVNREAELFRQLAEGTPEQRDRAIAQLRSGYYSDVPMSTWNNEDAVMALHNAAKDRWAGELQEASTPLVNALSVVINAASNHGVVPDPTYFGINPESGYWQTALLTNPAYRSLMEGRAAELNEAAEQAAPDILGRVESYATTTSPEILSTVGPSAVYNALVDDFGAEVVGAVLGSPAELQAQTLDMSQAYQQAKGVVNEYFSRHGYDINTFGDRQNAVGELSYISQQASGLLGELRGHENRPGTKPPGANAMFSEIMQALGRPVPSWQLSMMGTGDMINQLTPALAEINNILGSLNYLNPRTFDMGPVQTSPGGTDSTSGGR